VSLALGLLLAYVGWLPTATTPAYGQSNNPPAADANLAMNDPDQFAWQVFAQISQPANNGTNDVLWETWADQDSVYTNDPGQPPVWPGTTHYIKHLGPSLQHLGTNLPPDVDPGKDDVHINQATFDYVLDNQLWYLAGVAAYAQNNPVKFPTDSITVKARWAKITPAQKPRYHWFEGDVLENGTRTHELVGLVSLHVASKVIPNWAWMTFEQVDNLGRCDYIGCHDSFGQTPFNVPTSQTLGKAYPPGMLTNGVLQLFAAGGINPEWTFYRLKGTQIDFTTPTGAPTLLGNSVTEAGFVPTSSCMTCHARATINSQQSSLQVFLQTQSLTSANGAPDPAWYTSADAQGPQTLYAQTDFLWELPFIEQIKATDGGA
jgi:hypothetical protein